ncbi:MAG: tRNA preQ1(34) S-adenosylmethionine ribosyltransferase-isomerase QueA [Planctomycetes bacterium]|nr:tRNA preQ1(34) S-adenosylmethionine ribosyltransferase-isomerase QueA [Planctomycetota bacterium]
MTPQDFNYELPEALIAQHPGTARDTCRLLRLERRTGRLGDHRFDELPSLLRRGDLLVLNDTAVVPAKFVAHRPTGGRIEGLFLRADDEGRWSVLLRGAGRCREGEALALGERWRLILLRRGAEGQWQVRPDPPAPAATVLDAVGSTPLPPYIHRGGGGAEDASDRQSYQTVFARAPGAVAAPTAGLHFTEALLDRLAAAGIERTTVTLHVGLGTFLPVKAATLGEHRMHSEWYDLPAGAVEAIARTRAGGGRIVAVGTTAVRVLESAARREGPLAPHSGWTDIFLYPPCPFALTDALITNFHLPASTLIMLVAAFCDPGGTAGREMILGAYRQAVQRGYRFYSYGDAMLIV